MSTELVEVADWTPAGKYVDAGESFTLDFNFKNPKTNTYLDNVNAITALTMEVRDQDGGVIRTATDILNDAGGIGSVSVIDDKLHAKVKLQSTDTAWSSANYGTEEWHLIQFVFEYTDEDGVEREGIYTGKVLVKRLPTAS